MLRTSLASLFGFKAVFYYQNKGQRASDSRSYLRSFCFWGNKQPTTWKKSLWKHRFQSFWAQNLLVRLPLRKLERSHPLWHEVVLPIVSFVTGCSMILRSRRFGTNHHTTAASITTDMQTHARTKTMFFLAYWNNREVVKNTGRFWFHVQNCAKQSNRTVTSCHRHAPVTIIEEKKAATTTQPAKHAKKKYNQMTNQNQPQIAQTTSQLHNSLLHHYIYAKHDKQASSSD